MSILTNYYQRGGIIHKLSTMRPITPETITPCQITTYEIVQYCWSRGLIRFPPLAIIFA